MVRPQSDFIIQGPDIGREKLALDSVYALFFLPEHFKLIFISDTKSANSFFNNLMEHAGGVGVSSRVSFTPALLKADAIVLPSAGNSRSLAGVTGDSPEALASAILDLARTASV